MTAKVYIETSVVSYQAALTSRDIVIAGHQQATLDFWRKLGIKFQPFISALVIKEAGKGDLEKAQARLRIIQEFAVIQITSESENLAEKIIAGRGIPKEYPEDALHIAVAAVGNMDFLVTWNFSHIHNPFAHKKIRQTVQNEGYICPEIVSPDELIGES